MKDERYYKNWKDYTLQNNTNELSHKQEFGQKHNKMLAQKMKNLKPEKTNAAIKTNPK